MNDFEHRVEVTREVSKLLHTAIAAARIAGMDSMMFMRVTARELEVVIDNVTSVDVAMRGNASNMLTIAMQFTLPIDERIALHQAIPKPTGHQCRRALREQGPSPDGWRSWADTDANRAYLKHVASSLRGVIPGVRVFFYAVEHKFKIILDQNKDT